MLSEQLPMVGARINYISNLGTVRFVGAVHGTSGVWLGIEWDDARRGKHSGSKDGKQYFTCIVPNSATFIRPSASIVLGQSFLRALLSKYVEVPSEAVNEKVMLGSSNGAIEVEVVGMNKVRSKLSKLGALREISLDTENVACADTSGEISKTCPNIKGLDLSHSLLPSWKSVAFITRELPWLETLSLNFNRLQLHPEDFLAGSFSSVQDLRLNGTLTTWETLLTLLPSFPKLTRLEMGLNRLQALVAPKTPLVSTRLETLNLEENELTSWQNILYSVACFSQLDRLILSGNMVANIPAISSNHHQLPQVKRLALASSNIQGWSDIDEICGWMPNIQALNINSTPIDKEPSSRPLIIARIPTLTVLNASVISSAERRDSELFYLSYVAKYGPSSHSDRDRLFPRYGELCHKHGGPDDIKAEAGAETLRNRLIEIHFFQMSPTPSLEFELPEPAFSIRVLPSMTLRLLCSKILKTRKMPARTKITMWLVLERESLRELAEMKDEQNTRPLEWWGVENNCKIVFTTT